MSAQRRSKALAVVSLAVALTVFPAACDSWQEPLGPEGAGSFASEAPNFARSAVTVCHQSNGRRGYIRITVVDRAAQAHLRHGDGSIGDPVPGHAGMVFDDNCVPVAGTLAYILAAHPTTAGTNISILSTADLSQVANVPLDFIGGLAITPDGAFVYATRRFPDPGGVYVLETATNTVVATIDDVGRSLRGGVAISPDGATAYVPHSRSRPGTNGVPPGFDGKLSIIETSGNTVVETVDYDGQPNAVAVSPDGSVVYVVVGPALGSVVAIDAGTRTVETTVPVGQTPIDVAFTPDGAFAYVTNVNSNSVSVIETSTGLVVKTISNVAGPDGGPWGVAITPDGTMAYVTNNRDDTVSVIDTATNTVIDRIDVGRQARGLAITPGGAFAWIANFAESSISVVETIGGTVVATIPLGDQPIEIVMSPLPSP